MKREATASPKFEGLALRLDLQRWEAMGLLEALWHFTARVARRGDIGRWTDEQIARSIGWNRTEAGELVRALVAERWVDVSDEHRLVVHDWSTHADDAIHIALARSGEHFADGVRPKLNRLSKRERARISKIFRAHTKAISVRTPCAQMRTTSAPPEPEPEPEPRQSQSQSQKPVNKETIPTKNETGEKRRLDRVAPDPHPPEAGGEGPMIGPVLETWNRTAPTVGLPMLNGNALSERESRAFFELIAAGIPVSRVCHAIEQIPKQRWLVDVGPGGTPEVPRPITLGWLISDPDRIAKVGARAYAGSSA